MVVVRLRPYDPHSLGSPGVAKDEIDSGLHSLVWSSNRRILTHTPTNNKKPSAKADGFLWLGGTVPNSLLSNDSGAVSGVWIAPGLRQGETVGTVQRGYVSNG